MLGGIFTSYLSWEELEKLRPGASRSPEAASAAARQLATKEPVQAAYERSDWCVVPAGGVAGEAMVALVLADAFLQKFGGDSLAETRRNFESYGRQIDEF